jgi:ribulose-5-phosphate 4-epimerase/fuculose-1-phosphate aldolase
MTCNNSLPRTSANRHYERVVRRGLTNLFPVHPEGLNSGTTGNDHLFEFLLAEPYSTMTGYFLERGTGKLIPVDSESALFLPEIPVIEATGEEKGTIPGRGAEISGHGRMKIRSDRGEEFAFVLFSIACFSLFVKFFHTILKRKESGTITTRDFDFLDRVRTYEYKYVPFVQNTDRCSGTGLPAALESAGREIVSRRLVDSIFGNISALNGENIYISTSGSYLDELEGNSVRIPLNGPVPEGLRPSSELEVHRNIYTNTGFSAILHGHPLFTVILSLNIGADPRLVPGLKKINSYQGKQPITLNITSGVPEPGVPYPPEPVLKAIRRDGNVIISGHGVFCAGNEFEHPLRQMTDIENYCREEYFRRMI